MNVGKIISDRRKELGLTLEEVGKAVGVGKSTVLKWERGYISNMRRDKIAILARVLQIAPTDLLNEDGFETVAEKDDDREGLVLTAEELRIIRAYRLANEGIQEAVAKLLDVEREKEDATE